MKKEEFSKELNDYLDILNVSSEEKVLERFYLYMQLLLDWNEKINLTAIVEPKEIILKHFVDCATALKYLDINSKILDLGTGAGFPGIPLKILNDKIDITLVDSLNKRINFLNEVIDNLKLNNIKTIHARAEDLARQKGFRENYDVILSRAVANMSVLLEYTLPFLKVGGKCICMKGPNVEEELNNSKKALKILGGEIEKIEKLNLPNSNIERNIIIIKKIKETPKQYPRKAGKPSKEPIA